MENTLRIPAPTVIEGEASESDIEDDEIITGKDADKIKRIVTPTADPSITSCKTSEVICSERLGSEDSGRQQTQPSRSGSGLLVSGEASESEDESDASVTVGGTPLQLYPPLKVESFSGPSSSTSVSSPPTPHPNQPAQDRLIQYDSLLHRKLKEANDRLGNHIGSFKSKLFENATKDLYNISLQLSKTQALNKETCTTTRMISKDLFLLEDKLDIVSSCTLIPSINIALSPNPKPPSKSALGASG